MCQVPVERTKYNPNIENIKWNFLINLQQLMSDHTKRAVSLLHQQVGLKLGQLRQWPQEREEVLSHSLYHWLP